MHLHGLLASAPALRHLTIVDEIKATLPVAAGTPNILPLASNSLQTLNYEITSDPKADPYAGLTRSYYNYLSGSLISGGLPNLRTVYVRDANFPDSLLGLPAPPLLPFTDGGVGRPASSGSPSAAASPRSFTGGSVHPSAHHLSPSFRPAPPVSLQANLLPGAQGDASRRPAAQGGMPWAAGHNPRFSTNNPFAALISPQRVQTLEVFTKGDDDIGWSAVKVSPDEVPVPSRVGRPHSSYGLGSDFSTAAGARKSVFMSTGTGHFLAVPDRQVTNGSTQNGRPRAQASDEWPRPVSSASETKRERLDLWR